MSATNKSGPEITDHYRLVYPTEYICAADLRGKDVTVIIDRVTMDDLVMQGGKRDQKAAIHMRSVSGRPLGKKWVVGKTVLRQIAGAVGETHVGKWKGAKVTLYGTTCKGARGEEMECIRVRVRTNAAAVEVPEDMAREPEPRVAFADEAAAEQEGGAA